MQDHYNQSTSETIDLISDLGITSDAWSLDPPDDNVQITSDFWAMSIEDDKRVTTETSMMSVESNKNDLQESNGEEQLKSFDSTPDFKPDSKPSKQSHTGSDLALLDINDIQVWDILIDCGEKSTKHPGNLRFRNLVKEMKEKHNVSTVDNTQLMKEVSKCIVAHVTSYGGRFLRQIPGSDQKWTIMTTDKSMEATYQQMLEEIGVVVMGTAVRQQVSTGDIRFASVMNHTNSETPARSGDMRVAPCPPPGTEIHEDDIRPSDVLAGRGAKSNKRKRNVQYRNLVEQLKDEYQTKEEVADKNMLVRAFVKHLKEVHNVRFLKKRSHMKSEKMWVVMDDDKIRDKVSQSLREPKKARKG